MWHINREAGLDPAHAKRVLNRLERDVFPQIGALQIAAITAPQILDMIRKVEARGALDISRRLKQGVSQVFRFAIANGLAQQDPTIHLLGALKPKPRVRHMARVPIKALPQLVTAIARYDGEETPRCGEVTRDALMFTLLTWSRTVETRFAIWDEFEDLDGDEPLWRIPSERMKMRREHLVPLSRQVVDVLRRRRRATNGRFVFPGDKLDAPISENTMIYACYRMGYRRRQTVHGFRGIASTWANEAEAYNPDWIEMALAHSDADEVRGAYNSALYLTPRRKMLQDWANMLAKVAPALASACANSERPPSSRGSGRLSNSKDERLLPPGRAKPGLRLVCLNGQKC
jgi:integrase